MNKTDFVDRFYNSPDFNLLHTPQVAYHSLDHFKNLGFSEAQRRHFDRITSYLETCPDPYVAQQLKWYMHQEAPQIRDDNYNTRLLL